MTQPSFILLTKTSISLASISFLVLPLQINNLATRKNHREHQCPQRHRMAQNVLGRVTLEVDEGTYEGRAVGYRNDHANRNGADIVRCDVVRDPCL